MQNTLGTKIGNAAKWSSITEVCAKLVTPISSMILARLLTPDAFGVVATINIVISFTDIFTDAGFQKYLVQHEFKSDKDRAEGANVAFWTNLAISLFLWAIIIVFRDELATMVGSPGKGNVLAVACVVLPMTSFSSIQAALFRRDFDFKTLFYTRIVGVCIPLVVTVPLAVCFRSYWALILGTIAKNFADAVILTWRSKWKPSFHYSFAVLKEMFSFSMWTLFEQISIWLTSYIDTFIVGIYLSSYYVGLYKTSMSTVSQITALITHAVTPVLFSALSRLQDDKKEFENVFLRFQRLAGLLIVPMSIGMYLYRDFLTLFLLGDQWTEASTFVGLWALTSSLGILLNNFCSEAYRALGKPKVSLVVQICHLVCLVPAMLISAQQGFETLYWTRSLIRLQMYLCQLVALYCVTRISAIKLVKNLYAPFLSAIVMAFAALGLQTVSDSMAWSFVSILICVLVYGAVIMLFPQIRKELLPFITDMVKKFKSSKAKGKKKMKKLKNGFAAVKKDPGIIVAKLASIGALNWMNDEMYLKIRYRLELGRKLDLKDPKTYNEKLQWLKLYDRKPEYTRMVDKYEAKDYVAGKIGEEYVIPTLGVWDRFEDIDFDTLPDQFVLKCTHDSGGLVICKDKAHLDKEKAKEKINTSLKRNYYLSGREWPYKNVKPRIIAEKYMEDPQNGDLRDYKIFTFNGKAKLLFIASERQNKNEETRFDFFDTEFNHLPFTNGHPNAKTQPEKPQAFEKMLKLAEELSENIPHLRVDFYEVEGKIYFGELTFFHWSGMMPFEPEEWDYTLGEWITLPAEKTR